MDQEVPKNILNARYDVPHNSLIIQRPLLDVLGARADLSDAGGVLRWDL